jgi:hypothetical protein
MTITFETDSDVIIYALEKIISFARENQFLFVANCAWWIAGIIGLDSGLITYIDNLESRKRAYQPREISTTPRDLTEDQRLDPILDSAERTIQESTRDRLRLQSNRVNPLPKTKNQLKKARKLERLQEEKRKSEIEKNKQLRKIRATVINNLSKE